MTYSTDLRKRVLKYVEDGGSKEDAVNIFGVCMKTIWNWIKRNKQGNLPPKIKEVRPRKIDNDRLKKCIEDNPDAYLREIAEEFDVTASAVFYACKRLRITLKKRQQITKNETKKKRNLFKRTRKYY